MHTNPLMADALESLFNAKRHAPVPFSRHEPG
jgi:hypothetical protein